MRRLNPARAWRILTGPSSHHPHRRQAQRRLPPTLTLAAALIVMLSPIALSGNIDEVRGQPRAVNAAAPPASGTPRTRASPSAATPVAPSPTPAPIPSPPATPTVFRSPVVDIEPVIWTTALDPRTKGPRDRVATYASEAPAIYACLRLPHVRRGTTITAGWSYNETPIEGFSSSVTAERDEENVWIEFHLTRAAATRWPTGVYQIVVTSGGQMVQVAAVNVVGR